MTGRTSRARTATATEALRCLPARRALRRGGLAAVVALAAAVAIGACAPRLQPPGAGRVSPHLLEDRFVAADGVELPLRRWMPEDPPKAVILALHGFNDYSDAFLDPGRYWAERGIAAYAFDQRGFGEAPHRGLWPGTEALIADLREVSLALRRRHPQTPLFLLGDSMGGAVVLTAMAAEPPPVDGVILVAPAVWARHTMNPIQRGALWLAAHTVPWLKVSGRGLRIRASDNVEMLRALGEDPLVIKESRIDALYGLANLMDEAMESASGLPVPALVLYGDNDEVIPAAPTHELLRRLPGASAPRWRAAFYEKGFHMLLRDLQAEVVLEDIIAWIEDRQAALPSQAEEHAAEALAAE